MDAHGRLRRRPLVHNRVHRTFREESNQVSSIEITVRGVSVEFIDVIVNSLKSVFLPNDLSRELWFTASQTSEVSGLMIAKVTIAFVWMGLVLIQESKDLASEDFSWHRSKIRERNSGVLYLQNATAMAWGTMKGFYLSSWTKWNLNLNSSKITFTNLVKGFLADMLFMSTKLFIEAT